MAEIGGGVAKTKRLHCATMRLRLRLGLGLGLGLGSHCAIANETSPHCVGIYDSEELVKVRETSRSEVSAN